MNTQVSHSEAALDFRRSLKLLRGVALLLLLLIAVGCQRGSAAPAAVAEAESQPAPSATPPPTATPVPPTVTPEPPPAPTEEAVPEAVTIPYMDPDTDKDVAFLTQWLRIHRPATASAPHPTVFLLPGGNYGPDNYEDLVEHLIDRGYAVVAVKWSDDDMHCAFAWLMENTAAYNLDPQRIFVLGHTAGGMVGSTMPLYDKTASAREMVECPYPAYDPAAIKGVITYDGLFGIPEGTLGRFPSHYAPGFGVSGADVLKAVETLSSVPPQEWSDSTLLDDSTRKIAQMLPLYWVHIAGSSHAVTPPYLLIYDGDINQGLDFTTEANLMAENMQAAGIDVTLMLLDNAKYTDLVSTLTDVPARVAEAIDAFITEKSQ
ncbi:MAG: alpha/beta hydrolase [Anaerolineae bacterium]|nr:alpha/beta hydrolase [Anaerolineae bacterium]